MRLNSIQIVFTFLFITIGFSQNKHDSLLHVLKGTRNDIDRVNVLNEISNGYKTSDVKQMNYYAEEAYSLSQKIDFNKGKGNALRNLGTAAIISGDYKKALDCFQKAAQLFEDEIQFGKSDQHIEQGLAKIYGSIGIVFAEQSNYSKALQYYLKSAKLFEKLKDEANSAILYNNIGVVYLSQSSNFKALEYFTKAQKIQEKNADEGAGITHTNIANIYRQTKDYSSALEHYNEAKKILNKTKDFRALGEWYNNIGLYYHEIGDTSNAIKNWEEAIQSFETIGDKFGQADTYIHLGQMYLDQNQFSQAIQMVQKAIGYTKETDVLEQKVLGEKLLSDIYTKQGKPDLALQHFINYDKLKDSLINEQQIRKSVELEMNYEFEKHQLEMDKKELLYKEEAKLHKTQLIFVLLLAFLLLSIGLLVYNRIQLKKTFLLQKELAEYEQKALHLQMNPHFVFNCLGSISSFIVQNSTDEAIKYLSKFSKLMRLTLEYSKENLIPIDKEIESLQNYLELEQLRFNYKFDFSILKSKELEDDMALPPLLLQPFVENAIIHGLVPKNEKGNITIRFELEKDNLVCTIIDDGIGFNQSQLLKENLVAVHKSMALDITKKRLEMMEAYTDKKTKVEIQELKSNENIVGTQVILCLPVQYKETKL
ncbi:tetratricopeptide repeat-containing sensor histidine kinase [Flavobacterium sp. U410]